METVMVKDYLNKTVRFRREDVMLFQRCKLESG
jgi:hypothetical protein